MAFRQVQVDIRDLLLGPKGALDSFFGVGGRGGA